MHCLPSGPGFGAGEQHELPYHKLQAPYIRPAVTLSARTIRVGARVRGRCSCCGSRTRSSRTSSRPISRHSTRAACRAARVGVPHSRPGECYDQGWGEACAAVWPATMATLCSTANMSGFTMPREVKKKLYSGERCNECMALFRQQCRYAHTLSLNTGLGDDHRYTELGSEAQACTASAYAWGEPALRVLVPATAQTSARSTPLDAAPAANEGRSTPTHGTTEALH